MFIVSIQNDQQEGKNGNLRPYILAFLAEEYYCKSRLKKKDEAIGQNRSDTAKSEVFIW